MVASSDPSQAMFGIEIPQKLGLCARCRPERRHLASALDRRRRARGRFRRAQSIRREEPGEPELIRV
jgi:hypothetical protein